MARFNAVSVRQEMVLSAALLDDPKPSEDEIRNGIAESVPLYGTFQIIQAIKAASGKG
jgi:ribosomal protein S24E